MGATPIEAAPMEAAEMEATAMTASQQRWCFALVLEHTQQQGKKESNNQLAAKVTMLASHSGGKRGIVVGNDGDDDVFTKPPNKDQSAYAFDYSLNAFQLAASPALDSLMLAAMAETLVDTPSTDEIQTETVEAASTTTKEVASSSPLNMEFPMEISFLAFFMQHRAEGGALKKNENNHQ